MPEIWLGIRQARELVLQLLDGLRRALAVMEVGFMDGDGHRQPKCVNHNMFLAACGLAGDDVQKVSHSLSLGENVSSSFLARL